MTGGCLCQVGMDETSAAKGHDYVSVFMALDSRGVPFATRGQERRHGRAFAEDLAAHCGDPGKIARTSSGMSAAFIAGSAATCRTRR